MVVESEGLLYSKEADGDMKGTPIQEMCVRMKAWIEFSISAAQGAEV